MASEEQTDSQEAAPNSDTATVVRDAVILQGKLLIDGLRDAILIPLSLIAALISLTQSGPERGRFFYDIVRMGRRSERWINLFEAADRVYPEEERKADDAADLDHYLEEVEIRLARELRAGGVKQSARQVIDSLAERIHAARSSVGQGDEMDKRP